MRPTCGQGSGVDIPVPFEFTTSPDGAWVPEIENSMERNRQALSFVTPIANYRIATGEWPGSWDDLITEYIIFIPIDPETGTDYLLLNIDQVEGYAPSNSIVAEWGDDGCNLYCALPTRMQDTWVGKGFGKDIFLDAVEVSMNGPGKGGEIGAGFDDPFYRMSLTLSGWAYTGIGAHFSRTGILPDSIDSLMSGFKINPDFNPNYSVNVENNAGRFVVATYPAENKFYWRFYFDDPESSAQYGMQYQGESQIDQKPIKLSEEVLDNFTAIMDENTFLN